MNNLVGHVSNLLLKTPSQRSLPKEWLLELANLSIEERNELADTCDAVLDSFKAHVKDLELIKHLAEEKPSIRLIK